MSNNLESDSDSDSDYSPEADEEENVEEVEERVSNIPLSRKRKADSIFDDMVAKDNEEVETKMHNTVSYLTREGKQHKARRKKKQHLQDVMTTIFGSQSSTYKKFSSSRGIGRSKKGDDASSHEKSTDILEAAKELVKKRQRKEVVTETKKFAGQEISVERTVNPGSAAPVSGSSSRSSTAKETDNSLDKVLLDIKGPQAISTVSKSSMDWDTYKDKEGLEEDLADATKEGYLTRKDFLERCDVRAFEKERDQRLLASSKK